MCQIRGSFESYDLNKDGKIEFSEFVQVMNDDKEDIRNMIIIFDLNGDQMIDKEEFKEIPSMYDDSD